MSTPDQTDGTSEPDPKEATVPEISPAQAIRAIISELKKDGTRGAPIRDVIYANVGVVLQLGENGFYKKMGSEGSILQALTVARDNAQKPGAAPEIAEAVSVVTKFLLRATERTSLADAGKHTLDAVASKDGPGYKSL
jgi:hypothetical protein